MVNSCFALQNQHTATSGSYNQSRITGEPTKTRGTQSDRWGGKREGENNDLSVAAAAADDDDDDDGDDDIDNDKGDDSGDDDGANVKGEVWGDTD